MVIIDFFKQVDVTWEELQKKALSAVDEFQKGVINFENGELSPDIQYEDYRQALKLGMKTFIMQVLNDWKGSEETILIFKDKFFQRFTTIELDGIVKNIKTPFKFENSKKLFKTLKESKIQVKLDEFEKILSSFEEHNTIATLIVVDYQLFELDEVIDTKYSSESFKSEYDEDNLEDLEDLEDML
jgi:hypothetical protein